MMIFCAFRRQSGQSIVDSVFSRGLYDLVILAIFVTLACLFTVVR